MSVAIKTLNPEILPYDVPPPDTHRFTPEQYELMTKLGCLTTEDRVELLEGWITDKMPQEPPHASGTEDVMDALRAVLPVGWLLRDQKPIRTADSLPEPDVTLAKGPKDRYRERHPSPPDIALVVEVADSSVDKDRVRKARIYARARIPVYWLINIPKRIVEVYTQPRAGKSPAYRQCQNYGRNDAIPLIIEGREIARIPVRDLLP